MLCEKCGKNIATTHIHSVVNGVVTEKNLCTNCATNEGYNDFTHNSLAQMLSSMLGGDIASDLNAEALRCPCCNSTFSDIAQSGKAGCSECYKIFYDRLLPYIKRVHGSTRHTGVVPDKVSIHDTESKNGISELKNKLNELIRDEKYEEAAVIRDKIKELESEQK